MPLTKIKTAFSKAGIDASFIGTTPHFNLYYNMKSHSLWTHYSSDLKENELTFDEGFEVFRYWTILEKLK